jgi:hypothetical protein
MNPVNWSIPTQPPRPTPSLANAISALITAKTAAGCRRIYVVGLRSYLRQFAAGRESMPVSEITVDLIEEWFANRAEAPITKASNIGRIGSLLGFAYRRGWIADNPCRRLEKMRIDPKPPRILSPADVRSMLHWVADNRPSALAWFVLGAYAGIRPSEGFKVSWESVNWSAGTLTIDAGASKVRHRRIVHLQPIALAWLKRAHAMDSRLPVSRETIGRVRRRMRKELPWMPRDQDILRHTAASYLLALHQDAGRVARELGNSAGVLLRHYTELVGRDIALTYWEVEEERLAA